MCVMFVMCAMCVCVCHVCVPYVCVMCAAGCSSTVSSSPPLALLFLNPHRSPSWPLPFPPCVRRHGHAKFRDAARTFWREPDLAGTAVLGYVKSHARLSHVVIRNAGHMVRPRASACFCGVCGTGRACSPCKRSTNVTFRA